MTHRNTVIVMAAALALSGASIASGETIQTTIGEEAKVWVYFTSRAASTRIVAMWQKKASDIDLLIFGNQPPPDGLLIGLGLATEDRLEIVELGAPPGGGVTFVAVVKASGPKTKVWFNVSTMGFESLQRAGLSTGKQSKVSTTRRRLAYFGTLDELAAEDPFFEKMRQSIRQAREMKRGTR